MESYTYTDLTVLIPAKNEEHTIGEIVQKLNTALPGVRIIVIDNGSTDGTFQKISKLNVYPVKELLAGKGNALRRGLPIVQTKYVAFHDADLEYDPNDCKKMYQLLAKNPNAIVVGNRTFINKLSSSFFANKFMQGLLFLRCGTRKAFDVDILSGTRMAKTDTILALNLEAPDFRIETEFTKKALLQKIPVLGTPVAYHPRSYAQGKKIKPRDILGLIVTALVP